MNLAATHSVRKRSVAVIGAGITGLAAAHRLVTADPDVSVTVFESSGRCGGIIQTISRDGFLVELGPDSFITNKPGGIQLCGEAGLSDQLIPTDVRWRRSLVLRKGCPVPVPDGFMLMAPSKPWAVLTSPVLSVRGKLRLLSEVFVPRRKSAEDESLSSFVRRRFGRETLDRLVQPLVGGIYTSDPEKLSLLATLPRFPEMEQRYGSVIRGTLSRSQSAHDSGAADSSGSGARYSLFLTTKNGLSQLTEAVSDKCMKSGRVRFLYNCRVTGICPADESGSRQSSQGAVHRNWCVHLADQSPDQLAEQFDAVIVTLPAWGASKLLSQDFFADLKTLLDSMEYASSAIVVSGHRLSDFTHPLDAFGLVIPAIEQREILAVSFSSRKFAGRSPEGHVLLRTFVGGAMQPELLERNDSQILETVDRELNSILGKGRAAVFAEVMRYNHAMPQYHVGHLKRVADIQSSLLKYPGLMLAGSSWYGVGIPDSIASGRQAADSFLESRS